MQSMPAQPTLPHTPLLSPSLPSSPSLSPLSLSLHVSSPTLTSKHLPPQPMEVYVDDETKLTLHGLQQHYVKLQDKEKNRKLFDLMDALEFNQVWICSLDNRNIV